ncbi:LOW QUALITY PROTEIN: amino-acid permease BAT1 [Populus alba x Populus x berolinensis]|nr:LOW QUALITY PROTEIN: amino-acid permease BAT1 [Populus alba x Populus x berolinensis]
MKTAISGVTFFKTLAITFSSMAVLSGHLSTGQASVMQDLQACYGDGLLSLSSLVPRARFTSGLLIWLDPSGGHLHPGASAWLETIGAVSVNWCSGNNKGGGYFAFKSNSTASLNKSLHSLALISIWWQVIGGLAVIVMLPLVATAHTICFFCVHTISKPSPETTGISSKPYAVILSVLLSNYCLYGYDTAAHLTEETRGADRTGPAAILSSIGIISVMGWAYYLALTFSIQDFNYLYDLNNETAGALVPAQIIYDALHGKYHNSTGAVVFLCIIWGSFFFCGLISNRRDNGIPFSPIWRRIHPKYKVPTNAVWLCAAISIILGLPILKLDVIFTAIVSISTIGWAILCPYLQGLSWLRKTSNQGPFIWESKKALFLLPTLYPIQWKTFNYAPIAVGMVFYADNAWWAFDARKWFKGPVRNIDLQNGRI